MQFTRNPGDNTKNVFFGGQIELFARLPMFVFSIYYFWINSRFLGTQNP